MAADTGLRHRMLALPFDDTSDARALRRAGMPWLARFDGWASHRVILLRRPDASEDLVPHELCHVWQMQHAPLRKPLS